MSSTRTYRRILAGASAGLVAATTLAACADAPVTVPASDAAARAEATGTFTPSPLPRRAIYTVADTTFSTFTYTPSQSVEQELPGGHRVKLPAYSVCDPLTSGYGVGTWSNTCAPLKTSLVFTSRSWKDASGQSRVTFSPDVRFVPTKTVTLFMRLTKEPSALPGIWWCPTGSTTCVDEVASDPSLLVDYEMEWEAANNEGYVFRRIKHFSGYHIIFRSDDGSL